MASRKIMSMVVLALAVAVMSLTSSEAQTLPAGGDTSCIQALIPCANFLNATKPPATCCDPLKKAFETQLKCLCAAFKNPALIAAANVDMTELLQLPSKCGFKADPTVCTTGVQAPASAPMAPGSSTEGSTPKAPPASGSSGASSLGPVSGLVLLLVGFMFY